MNVIKWHVKLVWTGPVGGADATHDLDVILDLPESHAHSPMSVLQIVGESVGVDWRTCRAAIARTMSAPGELRLLDTPTEIKLPD